jgi:adenosylcobinamide-phosphate guanylyltransferase
MMMHALVMAGGRGKRMSGTTEKPLIRLRGLELIGHVLTTLRRSADIDRIVVACTPESPATREYIVGRSDVELCDTGGNGYHLDMKEAVKNSGLRGPVLVVSADVPLLTESTISRAEHAFIASCAQSLSVLLPASSCLSSSTAPYEEEGRLVVPTGVNIVLAEALDMPRLTQCNLIIDSPYELININTPEDLRIAENACGNRY